MSISNSTTTTASTTFIDLATFSELESFTYGGKDAITLFVAQVQKANWFSFIPITLRHTSGTPDFGVQNLTASVNRSGDYVLNVWFRARIPLIGLRGNLTAGTAWRSDAGVAWTNNLMHNLIAKCNIAFNELIVQEFDNYYLDCLRAFKLNASKRVGYDNMIGQVGNMTTLQGNLSATASAGYAGAVGDGSYRSVPLPFWIDDVSGVALPVAALPFNDVKITYTFRRLQELVVVSPGRNTPAGFTAVEPTVADVVVWTDASTPGTATPTLGDPQTFAHYAVVHSDERVKMGDAPRDILITQVQIAQSYSVRDVTQRNTIDIRFAHSIVALFFMLENTSLVNLAAGVYGREGSNYTTQSALAIVGGNAPSNTVPTLGSDPIYYTQLLYENTARYSMSSDYYMWLSPYFFANSIPTDTGYHLISYSLNTFSADPAGSTNFSKLANVSIVHDCSNDAQLAANGTGYTGENTTTALQFINGGVLMPTFPQNFRAITLAINRNVARIANGSLGHPTL